jgi:hypothetical protein
MTTIAYVGNTNNLELNGLKSDLEDVYIDTATVTVTILDDAGVEVTGEGWPQNMSYVTNSNGNYVLSLTHSVNLTSGKHYTAVIDADGSSTSPAIERWGHWEFPFTAKIRKS